MQITHFWLHPAVILRFKCYSNSRLVALRFGLLRVPVVREVAMSRNSCLALSLVVFCTFTTWLTADDSRPAVAGLDVAELIDRLDDPVFSTRQEASENLAALGPAAIGRLAEVATAGSREAATRAVAVLREHYQKGDADVKASASDALTRLAAHHDASIAQRARDILNPPSASGRSTGRRGAVFVPVGPNANNFRRVTVADMNGQKSVEVDDRERRVKIETLPTGTIEVEITDKQNPAAAVRRFAVKNATELAQKDPELGRLYELHLGRAAQGVGIPPINPLARRPLPPAAGLRTTLDSIDAMLRRYRQRAETDPSAQRMVESLEQTRSQLQAIAR